MRPAYTLGPMPVGRAMTTLDTGTTRAGIDVLFQIVRRVEDWPAYLPHYRYVRFREHARDGGGVVEMSANRPFGLLNWPTWWLSEMSVDHEAHRVRFRHIAGVTKGMEVEWALEVVGEQVSVKLLHVWDGPRWPLVGIFAATTIIGPLFVHGIASRTLAGLIAQAERHLRGAA